MMTLRRHAYKKDPNRDAICECGQGRGEDVHQVLIWRKAPSGTWVTDTIGGVAWRCRSSRPGVWWPERLDISDDSSRDWSALANSSTLAEARKVCEQNREDNE